MCIFTFQGLGLGSVSWAEPTFLFKQDTGNSIYGGREVLTMETECMKDTWRTKPPQVLQEFILAQ